MGVVNMQVHFLSAQWLQMHHISYIKVEYPIVFLLCHQNCFDVILEFDIILLISRVKPI